MSNEDKKEIDKIYSSLSENVLDALALEVEYNEAGEAQAVKSVFAKWNSLKPAMKKIFANIKNPKVQNNDKSKSYFG